MFTKNWYKALAVEMSRVNETFQSVTGATQTLKASYYLYCLGLNEDGRNIPSIYKVRTTLEGNGGVIFGTGNTSPTIDDTTLSGSLVSNFSYSSSVSTARDETGITLTALYTVTNNNAEAITISEVAIIANLTEYNTSPDTHLKALVERTVLDTPVTIPAGGVGQVVYTITLNLPTATA